MAAQVVSGVGFLGAGAILLRGEVVRGLTTAASIWSVAAIGLAVGGGMYVAAIAATVLILIILAGIKPLERKFFEPRQHRELRLDAVRTAVTFETVTKTLGAISPRVKQLVVQPDDRTPELENVRISFTRVSEREFSFARDQLGRIPGVKTLREEVPALA
jgi:putative Mg2+ transporter-C (MgtC) family protein